MSDTPKTDAREAWMANDARYKAPEQTHQTMVNHIELLLSDCREREREAAEAWHESQALIKTAASTARALLLEIADENLAKTLAEMQALGHTRITISIHTEWAIRALEFLKQSYVEAEPGRV